MPNKKTFTIKPIRELIKQEIPKGEIVLDPFPFNYKEDALDYLRKCKKAKYGLFDPPYSPRQLKECYNGKGRYDTKSKTLLGLSSNAKEVKQAFSYAGNVKASQFMGELFAKKVKDKGFERIVFDRGGYIYHGRIKAFAEGLRKGGIKF